ncbi:MAG: hypothetical protein JZU53_15835 [Paludibacter sp.]|nr:hypothetical protein [Paludibacter sp.]
MDKYRKIYNDNYKANTVVSIFKSHFACFKMQQQNGKALDINQFLDSSIQNAIRMKRKLKMSGILPFVNQVLGTGREEELLIDVFENKRNEVVNLFLQDDLSDEEIIRLAYDITDHGKINSVQNLEDKLKLVKDFILKCYSMQRKRQLGDRTFGYLIKAEIISASTPKERLDEWRKFIGEEIKPSNPKLHDKPNRSRGEFGKDSQVLPQQLKDIQKFFIEIGLHDVADIVGKDIKDLSSKNN